MNQDPNERPNAWDFLNEEFGVRSPSGMNLIYYENLSEFGMGSPVGGICYWIDNNGNAYFIDSWCGGPPIWNEDETKAAIPKWTSAGASKILILDTSNLTISKLKTRYSILNLKSFRENQIIGIESPIYLPKMIQVDLTNTEIENINKLERTTIPD